MCCAGQRSASATMPSDPQEWAGWEKGDTVPARWTRYWLMQCRAGSFYRAIMASTGRRLGSQDAMKSRSAAIMLHRTSGEIIPGISIHTCPLIFTSQRQLVWASLHLHSLVCPPPPIQQEEKRENFSQKESICRATGFWIFVFPSVCKAHRISNHEIKLP